MDKETQDSFREEVRKGWLKQAWEIMLQCTVVMEDMESMDQLRSQAISMAGSLDTDLETMRNSLDAQKREEREKRKSLADTIRMMRSTISSYDEQLKTSMENVNQKRGAAMRLMRMAERALTWTYETPPAPGDAPPVEAIAAEAAAKPDLEVYEAPTEPDTQRPDHGPESMCPTENCQECDAISRAI